MKKFKKFTSVFIILGALVIALLIIGKSTLESAVLNDTNKLLAPVLPIPGSARPPVESLESLAELRSQPPAAGAGVNSTEGVAGKIVSGLLEKNPAGPSLLEGRRFIDVTNPEALVSQIIADELADFDYQEFKPEIKITDIKTTAASDKTTLETYFKNFQTIVRAGGETIPLNPRSFSAQDFALLARALEEPIEKLYQLTAPAMLASSHLEELRLLQAQRNIFLALGESESDPFRALMALQALSLIEDELALIKQIFLNFIAENNLTI